MGMWPQMETMLKKASNILFIIRAGWNSLKLIFGEFLTKTKIPAFLLL